MPEMAILGERQLLARLAVGVSGSRMAGQRWFDSARRVGSAIAQCGLTLVSGDAAGVDESAQVGALAASGSAVMVLPLGLAGWKPYASYLSNLADGNNVERRCHERLTPHPAATGSGGRRSGRPFLARSDSSSSSKRTGGFHERA